MKSSTPGKFRILSLDGGGVRGIIPSRILQEIEMRAKKPIYQLFDLIVGSSTGGMIALALTMPGESGGARYSAKDILAVYMNRSQEIFKTNLLHTITSGFGLWNAKYDRVNLDLVLQQCYGGARLSGSLLPTIVTSYSLTQNAPRFFSSRLAKTSGAEDFLLRDIVGGIVSAPTYFAPKAITSSTGLPDYIADAGIYANNPVEIGTTELQLLNPGVIEDEVMIVSVGAGRASLDKPAAQLLNSGVIGWVMQAGLIDIMMGIGSDISHWQTTALYPHTTRLQIELPHNMGHLDNASKDNLRGLLARTEAYISNNSPLIDQLCIKLLR